jgi:hypothetical protein
MGHDPELLNQSIATYRPGFFPWYSSQDAVRCLPVEGKGPWNGLCKKHAKICPDHLAVSRLSLASDSKVKNLLTFQVKARRFS